MDTKQQPSKPRAAGNATSPKVQPIKTSALSAPPSEIFQRFPNGLNWLRQSSALFSGFPC